VRECYTALKSLGKFQHIGALCEGPELTTARAPVASESARRLTRLAACEQRQHASGQHQSRDQRRPRLDQHGRQGVEAMVQISTDKAVNPSSVMGATKRLAENYCQALDLSGDGTRTHFITVRFGNVLGSTGSVVPLFQRQLAMGGPLTVTDPEVTRYFMTVREAVELVLMASTLGAADRAASGKIFVLDMGEPIKIVDLARKMIRLAGLIPEQDVKIAFTGLRPGEKMHEELLHHAEALMPTVYQGVMLAAPRAADGALLTRALAELEDAARAGRTADVLAGLQRLVPEFHAEAPGAAAQ